MRRTSSPLGAKFFCDTAHWAPSRESLRRLPVVPVFGRNLAKFRSGTMASSEAVVSGFEPSHIGCRGVPRGAGWAVSRHCPALLAALWVVVAALQDGGALGKRFLLSAPPPAPQGARHTLARTRDRSSVVSQHILEQILTSSMLLPLICSHTTSRQLAARTVLFPRT